MNLRVTKLMAGAAAFVFGGLFVGPLLAGPPHRGHAALMGTTTGGKAKKKNRSQTRCSITGEKLKNHGVFIDYEGQRVYFCCPACIHKFLDNPQAVFSKFEKEGIVPDNVQKTCPVCGAKVDQKTNKWFMYKGRKIYYGCPGCDKTFLKDPEKYLKKLGQPSANSGKHQKMGHMKDMH